MMKEKNSALSTPVQDARFSRYCSMGLGAAVLTGAVTTMDASVVYTNFNNQVFADTNTADALGTAYFFDFNADGTNDFTLVTRNQGSTSTANYARIFAGITGGNQVTPLNVVGTSSSGFIYPSRLNTGAAINAARPFVSLTSVTSSGSTTILPGSLAFGNGFPNSKWKTAGANQGFIGVSFNLPDGLHYGFIGVTVQAQGNGNLSRSFSLGGFGYETTPNTAIVTSGSVGTVVPEPSSIALVALGGIGLVAYRRRRAAASVQ